MDFSFCLPFPLSGLMLMVTAFSHSAMGHSMPLCKSGRLLSLISHIEHTPGTRGEQNPKF